MEIVLKYVGNGYWIPGVPARDLTQTDIDATGYSIAQLKGTGLYQPVTQKV
jgi:hypothetical protein